MKNRSRNEIIASILEIISRGRSATTRTKLMYGSFVSYNQLNEYLLLLLDNGLISQHHHQQQQKKNERDSPLFMITEKGTQFLNLYNQMNEMIPITVIQTN